MHPYNLSPETSELVSQFVQLPSPQELKDKLQPELQSAEDRVNHLAAVKSEKQSELDAAEAELSAEAIRLQRVRSAMEELGNVQPAG